MNLNKMVINLLPPNLKQEKKYRKIFKMIHLFLVSIILILLIVTMGVFADNYYTKKDLSGLQEKIKDQNQAMAKYKSLEDMVNSTNSKLSQIGSVNSTRIIWSNLINELAVTIPKNAQIKSLSTSSDSKTISLTGFAETRSDIAKFKEKMENSKYFKNVTFTSSVHDQEQGNFSFSITCEIEQTK